MKGRTNNIAGRPTKGAERRKPVTFRIQPALAEKLKQAAKDYGCSQSDIVEDWLKEWLG